MKRALLILFFTLCFFVDYKLREMERRYFLKLAMGRHLPKR
jgi:hypothetical protein